VTGVVMRWALDNDGWPKGEPTPWADFSSTPGNPDGAVVDSEGCLWLALWGAGQVVRLNYDGQVIGSVQLPVSQPSCPAFAGPTLEQFYITTAQEGLRYGTFPRRQVHITAMLLHPIGLTWTQRSIG